MAAMLRTCAEGPAAARKARPAPKDGHAAGNGDGGPLAAGEAAGEAHLEERLAGGVDAGSGVVDEFDVGVAAVGLGEAGEPVLFGGADDGGRGLPDFVRPGSGLHLWLSIDFWRHDDFGGLARAVRLHREKTGLESLDDFARCHCETLQPLSPEGGS
jgi:hypothetical protein